MKTEFRNRAFLPVVMPLGIIAFIAAFVGLFAWIMLYNTKDGALALAAVMATGVLVGIALAATDDELDVRRRAGVTLALGVPIVAGMVLAGTGGGVDSEALLNINREEISVVPEINVTLVATNSNNFEQSELTLPAGEEVAIIFENEEVGVPHNVAVKALPEGASEPESLSDPIGASPIVEGPSTDFLALELEAGAYYYWCQVHPIMNGVLTVAEGAEPAAA